MKLNVEQLDAAGIHSQTVFHITLPAFLKHFSMVGRGRRRLLASITRMLSSAFLYADYIPWLSFRTALGFNQAPTERYDLHEKGTFSGLVGKAIADFLAKRIDNVVYSVPYESEMIKKGISVQGQRPDLICITANGEKLAVEAKGYCKSKILENEMRRHKAQSSSGPINVNRSIAAVSFNIYEDICVKYHDPNSEDKYDGRDTKDITKEFYVDVAEISRFDEGLRVVFEDKTECAAIPIRSLLSGDLLRLFIRCPTYEVFALLDEKVHFAAKTGELPVIEHKMGEYFYLDSDGLGLLFFNATKCEISDKMIFVYES